MFDSNGFRSYIIDLETNSWLEKDMLSDRIEREGLFLIFGRKVYETWNPMPMKIKDMFKKRGIEFRTITQPKTMHFGGRESLIFEPLGVFALQEYVGEPRLICAGTFEFYRNTKGVYDIDGVFALPKETAIHLRRLGYNLREVDYLIEK